MLIPQQLQMIRPRQLFLIDGLGAALSAILLGIVLPSFASVFGVPPNILYGLGLVAALFAIYSLSCHLWFPDKWRPFLKGIAIANFLYCLITMGLIGYLYPQITWLGIGYFVGEVMIIGFLVAWEWRSVNKA